MDTILDVLSVNKSIDAYYELDSCFKKYKFTIPKERLLLFNYANIWYSTGIFTINEQRFEILYKPHCKLDETLYVTLKPYFYCSSKTFGKQMILKFYYMMLSNNNCDLSNTYVHSYSKSPADGSQSIEEFKHHCIYYATHANENVDELMLMFYVKFPQINSNSRMDATWQLWDDEESSFIAWIHEEVLDDVFILLANQ